MTNIQPHLSYVKDVYLCRNCIRRSLLDLFHVPRFPQTFQILEDLAIVRPIYKIYIQIQSYNYTKMECELYTQPYLLED